MLQVLQAGARETEEFMEQERTSLTEELRDSQQEVCRLEAAVRDLEGHLTEVTRHRDTLRYSWLSWRGFHCVVTGSLILAGMPSIYLIIN